MTAKLLRIDSGLYDVDLKDYEKYVDWSPGLPYFNLAPGQEHYKLLAYLSKQLEPRSLISDCGTLFGCSAAALAVNEDVNVVTYDVQDHIPTKQNSVWHLENVIPVNADCMNEVGSIARSDLVVLDIDPHDGQHELEFVQRLNVAEFKGILICDDISLSDEMKEFWNTVCQMQRDPRYNPQFRTLDLTKYGHWSGTGAIVFDPRVLDIEVPL